jgi:hypothetical protein
MKKNIIRTSIALILALTGVILSVVFLRPQQDVFKKNQSETPMAKVISTNNDVKKQGIDKIIWEPVQKGDLLYLGEKLKTSTSSNAKIEFIENNATVDIESDSLIVVNKNSQKLTLQVLEGSLFVSSNTANADMNVYSGANSSEAINIKNGDVSYSVNKDGKTDFNVIKGNVVSNNKFAENKFKELTPGFATTFFVDPKNDDGIFFKWRPLSEEYIVKLEIGNSRNNLAEKEDTQIDLANGLAKTKVMLGTLYWKLTAQNKNNPTDNFSSSIFKVTYNQKVPPLPVFPLQNDLVQLKELNAPLDFKWNVLNTFENITLEVYTAENLKTPLFTESVANQTYLETRKISKAGKYYWKLKGKMSGSEGILESPMQNFQVIIGEELQSPLPLSPEDQNIFYISNNEESNFKNLRLTWKNNPEANQYLVTIKRNDSSKEFRVPLNEFLAPAMGKGNYSWSVQSINAKNEVSKKINLRHFTISGMEGINFKNFKKEVYYYNELPVYNFSWNQVPGVLSYRLKISQRAGFENAEILKVKDPSFNYQVGKEGFYYVLVEGLNLNDIVMAQSEVTSFQVAKSPTPKTPLFLEANQKVIEATPNGDINFNLVNYQDTYLTQIEIKDNNGNVIEVSKNKSAKANFSGLQPGSFYAVAKFFDEHGQGSEYSERKKFIVPDKSAIAPPSARGVRVR